MVDAQKKHVCGFQCFGMSFSDPRPALRIPLSLMRGLVGIGPTPLPGGGGSLEHCLVPDPPPSLSSRRYYKIIETPAGYVGGDYPVIGVMVEVRPGGRQGTHNTGDPWHRDPSNP